MQSRQIANQAFDETKLFARMIAVLAVVTVALYLRALLTGGTITLAPSTSPEETAAIILAVMLAAGAISLLAAWRWELFGGLLAILCAVATAVLAAGLMQSGPLFAAFAYGSPLAVAGAIFLWHAWRQRIH